MFLARFRRMAALALLLGGSGIYAETVTINGDGFFTQYSGPATDGTSFVTVVKPTGAACTNCFIVPVTPGTIDQPPLRTGIGLGLGSETYSPGVPSLDFFDVITGGDMEALNQVQFTPLCPLCSGGVTPGVPFKIGTLSFVNGAFFFDAPASFNFQINYAYPDPASGVIIDATYSDTVVYVSTKFETTNTDQQNADYFYLENHPKLGIIGVYEIGAAGQVNLGSVDVMGQVDSPLNIVGFDNPTGGVFLAPSFAAVGVTPPSTSPVPEPSTTIVLGLAVSVMIWKRNRTLGACTPRSLTRRTGSD